MVVRGWLITGVGAGTLPPEGFLGYFTSFLPEANLYQPGQFIRWTPNAAIAGYITMICVDIPV